MWKGASPLTFLASVSGKYGITGSADTTQARGWDAAFGACVVRVKNKVDLVGARGFEPPTS